MVESRGLLLITGRLLKLKCLGLWAFQKRAANFLLNERDADGVTVLMLAGLSWSSGEGVQLLDQGAHVNAQSRCGNTALIHDRLQAGVHRPVHRPRSGLNGSVRL